MKREGDMITESVTGICQSEMDGEDHLADEVRYLCMARPVSPILKSNRDVYLGDDPLEQFKRKRIFL